MKENFPNLAKEIDFQEAQRVPIKLDPKRTTQGASYLKYQRLHTQAVRILWDYGHWHQRNWGAG